MSQGARTHRRCRVIANATTRSTPATPSNRAPRMVSRSGWSAGSWTCRTAPLISSAWTSTHCGSTTTSTRRRRTLAMSNGAYTEQELMVAVASREIRDGDVVFVGMRLPILAYAVAISTHAPNARGLFEVGLMRDRPAGAFLGTMGDPPNVAGALWATRMSNVMALMAQGQVDLGFIGGAAVGCVCHPHTSYICDVAQSQVVLTTRGG